MSDGLLRKYFVLRPKGEDWHGIASREAMRAYAKCVETLMPKLAQDLNEWVEREETAINQRTTDEETSH